MESASNLLLRLLRAYGGAADAETVADLSRPGSEARQVARDLCNLAHKRIVLRQIPDMNGLTDEGPWGGGPADGERFAEGLPALAGPERKRGFFARALRLRWVAAALVIAAASLAWAGWRLAASPALVEDHFDGRRLDSRLWRCERERVKQENGYLRLTNRGYLVTQREFPGPISIHFRWRYLDLGEQPLYQDHLTVVLRTTGLPRPKYPFEVQDGVLVQFDAVAGMAKIVFGPDRTTKYATRPEEAGFLPDTWYDVRITDDGATVRVYCTGPGMPARRPGTPLLEGQCADGAKTRHVAFYNRELVGGGAPRVAH